MVSREWCGYGETPLSGRQEDAFEVHLSNRHLAAHVAVVLLLCTSSLVLSSTQLMIAPERMFFTYKCELQLMKRNPSAFIKCHKHTRLLHNNSVQQNCIELHRIRIIELHN